MYLVASWTNDKFAMSSLHCEALSGSDMNVCVCVCKRKTVIMSSGNMEHRQNQPSVFIL